MFAPLQLRVLQLSGPFHYLPIKSNKFNWVFKAECCDRSILHLGGTEGVGVGVKAKTLSILKRQQSHYRTEGEVNVRSSDVPVG